ncbi:MAG TPA: hypothetical protein PK733_08805 [Clostridiales bacterium]|nr:hypothetical protein [Clostridiales bacterium]
MTTLKPRVLNYETKISKSEKITIIAPSSEYGIKGAHQIFNKIKVYSNADIADILVNPDKEILYDARGHVILIGNLSDSKCLKELYYKQLAVTDLHYPGLEGYEIRTLINPLGTGYNIIQIGYSDEKGLSKAIDIFCSEITLSSDSNSKTMPSSNLDATAFSIRYFNDLKPTRLHFPEGKVQELLNSSYSLDDPTIHYTAPIDEVGYLAYLTGNKKLLDLYYNSWKVLLKLEYGHLKLHKRVVCWRLHEITGMVPEEIRSDIVNFFYGWADGDEGVGSILRNIYQMPDFPRQNHGLIPSMGLVLLHDYFTKYYPELQRPAVWRETADRVHSVYFNGNWKPLCDGLCHGWWLSQPAMLEYGLFDDEHKYFENGGAGNAALCAMAVVNNEGWLPNSGDSDIIRQFPGYVLDMTSEYYRNGKAKYISNLAPIWRRGYSGPISFLPRMYDIGLKPEEPEELIGVTVIPIDPNVYNAWRDYPDIAHMVADTPPVAPIEKCFDKLAVRTGFNRKDEFLLIDGLGGGSHSYADAMGILDYEKYGVSFVVSEDQLYWIEPENHSMVTMYRDGKANKIPSFAEIDKIEEISGDKIYISMILKNKEEADWRREIYFIPDKFVMINDTIIANEEGDYSLETHFRTPGYVEINGNNFQSRKQTRYGDNVEFLLQINCSHQLNCSVKEIPLNYSYRALPGEGKPISIETDPLEYAKIRYHLQDDNIVLSACTGKTSIYMNKGDKVTFTSLLFASDEAKEVSIKEINGKFNVKIENEIYPTYFDSYSIQSAEKQKDGTLSATATELFKSHSDIAAINVFDSKIWCGLSNGDIISVDKSGNIRGIASLNTQIHDFTLHNGFIYTGCGTNSIIKMTDKGDLVWNIETVRIPTIYPWWELDYPGAMSLKIIKYKDKDTLIAGCGDNNIRFYDLDGNLLDSYYFFAAVPNVIESYDVNNDGKNEILLAGNIITCVSNVDVLDDNGKLLHKFGTENWTSIATVLKCFDIHGKKTVALGVNHRSNFKLYQFNPDSKDIKGEYIINDRLAGAVTGIDLDYDNGVIVAGTSQGFIAAYTVTGEQKWVKMINGIICDVKYFNKLFWIADEAGYVYKYNKDGVLIDTIYVNDKVKKLENVDEVMYIITKGSIYVLNEIY